MGTRHPEKYGLGQTRQSIPAIALHVDRAGACRFTDETVLANMAGLAKNSRSDPSITRTLATELQAWLPADVDMQSANGPLQFDSDISAAQGAVKFVRVCLFCAVDPVGQGDGNMLICYDITAQKQDQTALARKASSLEPLLACTNRANQATVFRQALNACMRIIGSFENWLYEGWLVTHACLLEADDSDRLLSSGIWCCRDRSVIALFIQLTQETQIGRGQGIPGRVLETGEPILIYAAGSDPDTLREM